MCMLISSVIIYRQLIVLNDNDYLSDTGLKDTHIEKH